MKLGPQELPKALAAGLEAIYVILGEEPLAALEAADAVRAAARGAGFAERVPLFVEPGFRWEGIAAEAASRSLFSERRLLDLKIPNGKLGNDGARTLAEYAATPAPDTLLLVTLMGAERKAATAAWAKAVARTGVLVECRPVPAARLPQWIAARMRARGITAPREAPAFVAEYVQGNLLAAAQAIERLALVAPDGRADMAAVREAVADEARYGLFECVDAALAGDAAKALHMLARLRETGTAEPVLLWAIARELRVLEAWAYAAECGGGRPNIWASRRALVEAAAKRRTLAGWQALMEEAAETDRAIKGRSSEAPWVLLERLLAALAGASYAKAA